MIRQRYAVGAALLSLVLAACATEAADTTSALAQATTSVTAAEATTTLPRATTTVAGHEHDSGSGLEITPQLANDLAQIRAGTAVYANSLDAALEDGFFMITQMIPDMGFHFLNPNIEGFDIAQPPILVYGRDGDDWELAAVEWVFPEEPDEPPMEGGTYGAFPAACHYEDGLFVPSATEEECAPAHPDTASEFTFWHPDLVTFHVWAWMHNAAGLFNGTNPLMTPYNG